MNGLGAIYDQERGDLGQAITWFTKSAEAGDAEDMLCLGIALMMKGDREAAIEWFTKADAAGEPEAKTYLAELRGNSRSGACYIATAVYGSYEAPAVLTLRGLRDETLTASAMGRAFIRLYYRIGPSLAKRFEQGTMPSRLAKRVLDALVSRLESEAS